MYEYDEKIYLGKCEYFCKSCGQLRLSFERDPGQCGNCDSTKLIVGEVGCLNKNLLKSEWKAELQK